MTLQRTRGHVCRSYNALLGDLRWSAPAKLPCAFDTPSYSSDICTQSLSYMSVALFEKKHGSYTCSYSQNDDSS